MSHPVLWFEVLGLDGNRLQQFYSRLFGWEIQALVLGVRIVRQFGDERLARASESILAKVAVVLPKALEPLLSETQLYVPSMSFGPGRLML